jgi:16S rRNA (guanine966-N2)-methyltransferase
MRIIAGRFRSRVLLGPEDERTTRPITDRAKQSLFDILTPLLEDAIVYDCFAGTGSMGLESLSRGARHATFFEVNRSALARLRKNIHELGVRDQSTIVSTDLFAHFAKAPLPQPDCAASLIFLDPPYRFLKEKAEAIGALAGRLSDHLTPEGLLVFRHDADDRLALAGFAPRDIRTYGGMMIELLGQDVRPA